MTGGIAVSSSVLHYPHGVDFLDDETIVVANREGGLAIFKLPDARANDCDLSPIQVVEPGSVVYSPGSVSVLPVENGLCELLVCNNYADSVSRHVVNAGGTMVKSEILLRKWLDFPDGVCTTGDGRWIAISNHSTHGVLLYERSEFLNQDSSPAGVLRGVSFPHGLRFSADGRHLFLADAGAPFVHVYTTDDGEWHGARGPAASIRVMDEQTFRTGRNNPQEGGPKGIDVDKSMTVLAVTSEYQPLQFLDLAAVLSAASSAPAVMEAEYEFGQLELAAIFKTQRRHADYRAATAEAKAAEADARAAAAERKIRELKAFAAHQEGRAEKFKAKAARLKARARAGFVIGGTPWRITAPLSRLFYALKRPN